jgi:hypothetical protein
MDVPTSRRAGVAADGEVLDEADPHAGDDVDWEHDERAAPIAAAAESTLLFWKGLLFGLLLSAAAWAVLAAIVLVLRDAVAS